jgi:hypothetical protein
MLCLASNERGVPCQLRIEPHRLILPDHEVRRIQRLWSPGPLRPRLH